MVDPRRKWLETTLNATYRPGLIIVIATVLVSFALCFVTVSRTPHAQRAAQDLGDSAFPLGTFSLIERSGKTLTENDLADRVVVASFIFTRCPLSCPKISTVMKGLQSKFEGTEVQLLSITVDPDHDTPAILADYAKRFSADPNRWWFATGPASEIQELIRERFKVGLVAASDADQKSGAEAFAHSDRLALIKDAKVVGYFDSNDSKTVQALIERAKSLSNGGGPSWIRQLPAVNATLNGSCALILALGWILIRTGNQTAHALCMISAVVVSAIFLTCYLIYHYNVGSVPFQGAGSIRVVYFTILLSHTLLATFGVVPLVAITVWHALNRQFDRHSKIARVTFPIWMYVSITGVVIYVLLYKTPV